MHSLVFMWVPNNWSRALARAQLARKNDTATGSCCTRLFSPVSSCLYLPCLYLPCLYLPCLYLPCLYLPCLYISLVFISPLFLYLPCLYLPCFYISLVFISPPNPGPLTLLYSQFPSTHSRPRHLTRHAASAKAPEIPTAACSKPP